MGYGWLTVVSHSPDARALAPGNQGPEPMNARSSSSASMLSAVFAAGMLATSAGAQDTIRLTSWGVDGYQKISSTQGGFTEPLDDLDGLGISLTGLDLNGDGRRELVAAVPGDDDVGVDRGALYVMFLDGGGAVQSTTKIAQGQGGFAASLDDFDYFGRGLASIGDLDDDGVGDLAVGAYRDDDGGFDSGAVYILFMNTDGTVKGAQKISSIAGNLSATLATGDLFGVRIAALGDLDGDGVEDIAAAASFTDDGGMDRGAVYVLFLNTNGTVKSHQKISSTSGGFGGTLSDLDAFGSALTAPGDVDRDGVCDLVVGARGDDDGGSGRGAVWVLAMKTDGTVKGQQKISATQGGFRGELSDGDNFGIAVEALGDVDGDGFRSIVVGAFEDDDGGGGRGAIWLFKLDTGGSVLSQRKISDTRGGFTGALGNGDGFGSGLGALGDLDGSGGLDLAVGAGADDDGGVLGGAVWVLHLRTKLAPRRNVGFQVP